MFLVIAPLIPPADGFRLYEHIPYWVSSLFFNSYDLGLTVVRYWGQLHALVATMISFVGVTYWYVHFRWLPKKGGYRLVQERVVDDDGFSRNVIKKVEDF